MPENTANFTDVLAVQVDVVQFKKSLEEMETAYQTFIKGLDEKTRSGLGQGLAGNLNTVLKDLSNSILEFRKDFTGSLSLLDTGLEKFFKSVESKTAASAQRRSKTVIDENERTQRIISENAARGLSEKETLSRLSLGSTPDPEELTRRDIDSAIQGAGNLFDKQKELLDLENRLFQLRGKSAELGFKSQITDATSLNEKASLKVHTTKSVATVENE